MKKHLRNARVVIVPMLLFSLFVVQLNAQPPSLQWAKEWGGGSGDLAQAVTMDAAGNLYVTGSFSNAAYMDPGSVTTIFTTTASSNVYVTKFNAAGNFQWAKQLGANSSDGDVATAIKLDATGNIYVTGTFTGTADFDPGPGVFNLVSPTIITSTFITKLDPNGNFIWAKSISPPGGATTVKIWGLAVDAAGNAYCTGSFSQTVDFDPGPGTQNLTAGLGNSPFVSKFDALGNLIWARGFVNTSVSANGGQSQDIALDAAGNIYTTGYFYGTLDFNPGSGVVNRTAAGIGTNDIFVSKLDASGNYVWVNTAGAAGTDQGYALHLDATGNVYVTGSFSQTVDFDPGPGIANLTATGTGTNVFVWKLDAAGNYILTRAMGGTGVNLGESITTDAAGNIYVAGYFGGTADFDPGSSTANLTSAGTRSAFAMVLNNGGNYTWAEGFGGAGSSTIPYTIITDPVTGSIYLAGQFTLTVDFDPDPVTTNYLTSLGSNDAFLLKLVPGISTGIVTGTVTGSPFCLGGSSTVNVPFTANGTFNSGNVFTAQLSDAAGSFASPVNIGTLNGTGSPFSGTINAIIPANTPAGTNYRIRVISSDIPLTGTDNGIDIVVNSNATIALSSVTGTDAQTVCAGNAITDITYTIGGSGNNAAITTGSVPTGITGAYNAGVFTISGTPTAAGSFTYTVTVTGSCAPLTISGTITVNAAPVVAIISGATLVCDGATTALTDATASGVWSSDNTAVAIVDNNGIVTGMAAGTATITYAVTNTCTTTPQYHTITISDRPAVAPVTATGNELCAGATLTLSDITAGGIWSSDNTAIATVSSNGTVTGITVGSTPIRYTVSGTCGDSSAVYPITIDPQPSLTVSHDTTICTGGQASLLATTDAGTTVQWSNTGSNSNPAIVNPSATTTYLLTATSSKGCSRGASVTVTVQDFAISLTASPNPAIIGNPFTLTTSSSLPYQVTSWQPANLFPNQTATSQTLTADVTRLYQVTAKTNEGCIDTDTLTVTVTWNGYDDVFVPNVFTPNSDGKNDMLNVKGTVITAMSMRIYNQSGTLVFESNDQNKGWDGTYKGSQQPVGVYVYVLRVSIQSGITLDKKGSITLIR